MRLHRVGPVTFSIRHPFSSVVTDDVGPRSPVFVHRLVFVPVLGPPNGPILDPDVGGKPGPTPHGPGENPAQYKHRHCESSKQCHSDRAPYPYKNS